MYIESSLPALYNKTKTQKRGCPKMSNIAQPIIKHICDTEDALSDFEDHILPNEDEQTQELIKNFPTIYIHNWKDSKNFEVYIGETNHIFRRTREHYALINDPKQWQSKLLKYPASLYIIGHEHFNKSMTLDIENRLMHYMMSVDSIKSVHNQRKNPQPHYYPMNEMDEIFQKIWRKLRRANKDLFPSESFIKDSAIYKASPLHKLTDEQKAAQNLILEKVYKALDDDETHQLIFIDGEAGTGKTVLNSSTFYELYCQAEEKNRSISCYLLVNHDQQVKVYEQIADKLGLTEKNKKIVSKPTTFINNHDPKCPVDVVFVDEAHLLLTQGKQSYKGKNQLYDIMQRARVTIVMFDEYQVLTTEQYWEADLLETYRNQAKRTNNYIKLAKQLRMQADPKIIDWIDSFTKEKILKKIPKSAGSYHLKIFDDPQTLDLEIQEKAKNEDSSLSRTIATYDWQYNQSKKSEERGKYWSVVINGWHKPWNYELISELSAKEQRAIKNLSWAEQPHTINEIGSTFSIQGFDLNYAGVILGPSVKYRNGKIIFDPNESCNAKAVRNRTLSDGSKKKFGETLIQHEVRVLMTRGVNGLYLYACDPQLREALKEAAK